MQFISTRTHGMLDYLAGALLIVAPWVFGFADAGPWAVWLPVVLGIGLIAVSLMTRYELSVAKLIPMPVHLTLDGGLGIILIASPWLFGFAETIWWPHVVVGIVELGGAMFTERHSPVEEPVPHAR